MSTERTSLAFPSLQADPYRPAAATTPGRLHDAVLLVAMLLLPFSLDEDIIVFCKVGGRSGMVVDYLRKNGFEKARNLRGGILAWSQQIDPTIKV